jgi:hypothetical protein
VAFLQALQIATGFANVSPRLILFAYDVMPFLIY